VVGFWKISPSLLSKLMRQQTMPNGGHLGGYYYFNSNAFLYLRHPAW
jgi:dolichol kinase